MRIGTGEEREELPNVPVDTDCFVPLCSPSKLPDARFAHDGFSGAPSILRRYNATADCGNASGTSRFVSYSEIYEKLMKR